MTAHNLDKLTDEQKDLVALLFTTPCGWTDTYMVEVKLDNPTKHMTEGGPGFSKHGGNGSRCYARHDGHPDWCVVHVNDVPDWDIPAMAKRGLKAVEAMMEESDA